MTDSGRMTRLIYGLNVTDVAADVEAAAAAQIDHQLTALKRRPRVAEAFEGVSFTQALGSAEAEHALIDAWVRYIHLPDEERPRDIFGGVLGSPRPRPLTDPAPPLPADPSAVTAYTYVVDQPDGDGWREICVGQRWVDSGPASVAVEELAAWTADGGDTGGRRVCVWAGWEWYAGEPDHTTDGTWRTRPVPSLLDEPTEPTAPREQPGIKDIRIANVYGADGISRPAIVVERTGIDPAAMQAAILRQGAALRARLENES